MADMALSQTRRFDSGAPSVDQLAPSELAGPRIRLSAVAVLSIWISLLVGSHLAVPNLHTEVLAIVGVSVVIALVLFESWFTFILWRVAGDSRALTMVAAGLILAVFPLFLGVLAPNLFDAPALDGLRTASALAGLPGVFLLAASVTRRRGGFARAGHLIVWTSLISLAVLALFAVPGHVIPLDDGVALPLAGPFTSGPLAFAFAGIALAHALAGRKRSGQLLSWSALAIAGVGGAYLIEASAGALAHPSAWTMVAIAVGLALYGAGVDLQRRERRRQAEGREALVAAALATTRAQAVQDSQQEQRHQAAAALLGIEAAAQGLNRNRELLTESEFQQLSEGLVAEVHRLRSMIDEQSRATITRFDLREAIEPVLTCARASGVELIVAIPVGIEVFGAPCRTAEACATVLQNAQDHAPGSIVELRAEVRDGIARLLVEDRGPGLAATIAEEAFERGIRSPTSQGSGLGLYLAHRLMQEQDGSIRLQTRPGGGTSAALELPLASTRLKAVTS